MSQRKELIMQEDCPRFVAAVRALGKTRLERAAALKTDAKTVDRLLKRFPKPLAPFLAQPHLLRALADDLETRLSTGQN